MVESDNLRYTKIALNNGSGAIPALGFGTLIPDPIATRTATKAALEAGFRLLDAACTFPEKSASCDPPHEALNEPPDFWPQTRQRRQRRKFLLQRLAT
jgi:hypothetical protein